MPRPVEFDRDNAVEAAMQLFWRQGYTATSLSQLLAAMEIGRSSFYAAFSDKRCVYIEALTLFAARTNDILDEIRKQHGPALAIRLFFEQTLLAVPQKRVRRGCMMVNTVLELADVDQGLNKLAVQKLDEMEKAFEDCFRCAIREGYLSNDKDPQQLARFVMVVNQGLRVASRKNTSKRQLDELVETTLSQLGMAA